MRPARTNKATVTAFARPLIASALIAGGLVNLAAPVLAQTVPLANSGISNTATASYQDPNDLTNPDGTPKVTSTTSNTVTVTVAKVAGILVEKSGFEDVTTAGAFNAGDTIYANFNVTNTGNDALKFNVPKQATLTGKIGNNSTTSVQYYDPAATTPDKWVTVTTQGTLSQKIAVGGVLKVRVVFTIDTLATSGDSFGVKLGSTTDVKAINILRGSALNDTNNDYDIFTSDLNTPDSAVDGAAANGIREASDSQSTAVNAISKTFAKITLTNNPVTPNATTPAKDDVTYNIVASVPTSDPASPGAIGTALAPQAITVGGNAINRVLVNYPLPAGNTLASIPTAPTDWTPIYKVGGLWTATAPTIGTTVVTEVGFIYAPSGSTVAGTSLAPGSTTYAFTVKVLADPGATTSTATIAGNNTKADGTVSTPVTAFSIDAFDTTRATVRVIYNGTKTNPEATAPGGDNNRDFSNKSMKIDAADAGRTAGVLKPITIPSLVSFGNTVENKTNASSDVYLLPEKITDFVPPVGTTVTIKNSDGSITRTYTYTATGYVATADLMPLKLTIAAYTTASYAVDITLPANSGAAPVVQLKGYPVALTAFTTTGTVATSGTTNPVSVSTNADVKQNTTIDQVYTGYIDLIKEVRVFDAIAKKDDASIAYTDGTGIKATPGQFIQYRVKAKNVSEDGIGGADNVLLEASQIKMVENGTTNGWATSTSHIQSTAKTELFSSTGTASPLSSTIQFDGSAVDPASPTSVAVYNVDLGTQKVAPKQAGSFTFVRKVNQPFSSTP